MDVYGYPPYQYTQSDELAKQMFAHQALSSSVAYNQEMRSPHVVPGPSVMPGPSTMPAPSGAPWNMQGLPWGMQSPPTLVQFTGQNPQLESKIYPLVHSKRKSLDVEPVIPAKQLITEEKMAAHLNGLHISSEYTPHRLATEELMDVNMDTPSATTANFSEKLKDKFTVVISEEVKKIQTEPLLPPSLIERLEKPHMSLVVWKPKEDILEKIKEVVEDKKEECEEEQPKKRNGVLVVEHSGMDVEM
nr:unnamed protein product [Amyelois transitella]